MLSLVIPAYRSATYIEATVRSVLTAFDELGIRGEVIVVDDGSDDGTADAVPDLPGVRVVRQPVNAGKGAALRAGMAVARGEVRGFTDADLPYGTKPLDFGLRCIRTRGFHAAIGDRTLPGSTYSGAGAVRTVVSELASFAFRTLVTGGIYRVTRNPMYLGLALVLAAWAVFLLNPWSVLGPVVFVPYMTRFQIEPEERALVSLFGQQYTDYRQRVRRWI